MLLSTSPFVFINYLTVGTMVHFSGYCGMAGVALDVSISEQSVYLLVVALAETCQH